MRSRQALAIVFAALVVVGLATAATKPAVLKFATVVHDSKPVGSDEPYWDVTKLGEVRGWIIQDAATMTYEYFLFPTADQKKFDALDWNTHFVFLAATKQRSSGYRLTIKRVSLQRISRSARQLCVIASVEKPRVGQPVVVRPYFATHAVAVSSARFRIDQFHWAIPTRYVVRNPSGALLAVSRTGGSLGKDFVSGRPKLCTVQIRADDEDTAR